MKKKLKINFIIPFTSKTGGLVVVMEYYRQLTRLGHDVKIYYPMVPYKEFIPSNFPLYKKIISPIKRLIINLLKWQTKIKWYFEDIQIRPVLWIADFFIADADIVIATAWPTAYDVSRLFNRKGLKYYLIQHYENWNSDTNKVNNSYKLALNRLTIAPWLTKLLIDKFKVNIRAEIHNGIRLDKFFPLIEKSATNFTITMMCHDLIWKGTKEGLEALRRIKTEFQSVKICFFGMMDGPEKEFEFEYVRNPSHERLLNIYQTSHIFISPSHSEGWHLPPMEAMACKCAVVATNVGCIPVLYNGSNVKLIEIKNSESIYLAVKSLILNRAEVELLSENGYETIRKLTWEKSAEYLEHCFLSDNIDKNSILTL